MPAKRPEKSRSEERSAQESARLDLVFSALSDPVRRRILELLDGENRLVTELAEPFSISLQAVSRHIQVLEEAGLIQKERTGRISRCSLDLGPMLSAAVWINRYSKYWQDQFDLLAATLTQIEEQRPALGPRAQARAPRANKPATKLSPRREQPRRKPLVARAHKSSR